MNFQELKRLRPDLAFIANWVGTDRRVLDIGCGDGAMLSYLETDRQCRGYGIEIDDTQVAACVSLGVPVLQLDMKAGLALFGPDSFDSVLCLSALQMAKDVEGVLREIARVGREAIVSFPNFAYWPHRIALLRGRMPVSKSLPYEWYDTPNVRCATLNDFRQLADDIGLDVIECVALHEGRKIRMLPNWRGSLAVFRLRKKKDRDFPMSAAAPAPVDTTLSIPSNVV